VNSFGQIFRVSILGESHGPYVGIVIDGCPAGIPLKEADFLSDLERRKPGAKATTTRVEDDAPQIVSGGFNEHTTGAPLTILFANNNTRSSDYAKQRAIPRPGHADFVASKKFSGFEDYRGGGHFSGRLTVCLVAAGVVAKKILQQVTVKADVIEVAGESNIEKGLDKAIEANDSVGGIVECVVSGLPVGLGEPFFNSVESMLAHAVFAIPAVRGIEFGTGFPAARMFGSEHNDALVDSSGKTSTNNSGGVTGGLSNGNEVVFRIAVKPTSSTPKEQTSLNIRTGQMEEFAVKGRHDLCIALRVPVVLEAVTAIVFADLLLGDRARREA
jgi:chorismate synthase